MTALSVSPTTDWADTAPKAGPAEPVVAVVNPALRGPIVLAIQGNESSRAAISAAKRLSDRLHRELRVATVIEPLPQWSMVSDLYTMPAVVVQEVMETQEEAVLKLVKAELGDEAGSAIEVRYGDFAPEICKVAREFDATLILVDAAQYRTLFRAISGTKAAKLLRHAPCPVLSLTPDLPALPKRIVAAVDFSPASIRAVQTALLLASDSAEVELVHAPMFTPFNYPLRDKTGALFGGDVQGSIDRLREELARYAPGVRFTSSIVNSAPVEAILTSADRFRAEMIAMGSHGPGAIERLFLGSVAAGVLHHAPCSVLTAPAPRVAEFVRLELWLDDTVSLAAAEEWGAVLDTVSRENAGRRVRLEEDRVAFGAQLQARGYVLRGIVYDPRDRRVEIMLDAGHGEGHFTRMIPHVDHIAINTAHGGRDRALEISHESGHTLVLFEQSA